MSESIIDKIRALLRKTTENGSTKEEADSAMAMAEKLMVKHNIDRIRVDDKEREETRKNRPLNIVEIEHRTNRSRYEEDTYIAQIVRECCSVKILWSEDWERILGHTDKYGDRVHKYRKRLIYCVVGDKTDCEYAIVVITEIQGVMRRLFRDYRKRMGIPWTAVAAHSFYAGLARGYIDANRKAREEVLLESGEDASEKYGLILIGKEEATENFIKCNIQTVRCRSGGKRSDDWDGAAFSHGKNHGKSIKVGAAKLTNG